MAKVMRKEARHTQRRRPVFASVSSSVKWGDNVPFANLAVVIVSQTQGWKLTSSIIIVLPGILATEAGGREISRQAQIC